MDEDGSAMTSNHFGRLRVKAKAVNFHGCLELPLSSMWSRPKRMVRAIEMSGPSGHDIRLIGAESRSNRQVIRDGPDCANCSSDLAAASELPRHRRRIDFLACFGGSSIKRPYSLPLPPAKAGDGCPRIPASRNAVKESMASNATPATGFLINHSFARPQYPASRTECRRPPQEHPFS